MSNSREQLNKLWQDHMVEHYAAIKKKEEAFCIQERERKWEEKNMKNCKLLLKGRERTWWRVLHPRIEARCLSIYLMLQIWFWNHTSILRARGEGGDRGWGDWMASLTQWTWVWADSGRLWRTCEPGVLLSMGLQRVGHDWAIEQQQNHIRFKNQSPHFIPIKIANIKKKKITSVGEDVEKSEPCTWLVRCKIVQPFWRTKWCSSKK